MTVTVNRSDYARAVQLWLDQRGGVITGHWRFTGDTPPSQIINHLASLYIVFSLHLDSPIFIVKSIHVGKLK